MGNWRQVQIVGTCDEVEAKALREAVDFSDLERIMADSDTFGPLCHGGGLAGLPLWPSERIDVTGNCFERDYSVESIADHLRKLVDVAPSLELQVHCGGDWEAVEVINTITVKRGKVKIGKPKENQLPEVTESQMMGHLFQQISKQRR